MTPAAAQVERLYRQHHGMILAYCLNHLNDPAEAEDAAQEVWLRALQALARGARPRQPAAWLNRIARNLVYDAWRAKQRHYRIVGVDLTWEAAERQPDSQATPLEQAVASEWVRCIEMGLERLTDGQETALRLDWAGYSGMEMASEMGTTLGAAKAVLHRGRASLRELLEDMRT